MPQGSRLGPLSFIIMIDELHKYMYVDDTRLSELLPLSRFTSDKLMPQISVYSFMS